MAWVGGTIKFTIKYIPLLLLKHTDVNNSESFINKLRDTRMSSFTSAMEGKRTILDIGGTVEFWERYNNPKWNITILNLYEQQSNHDNIKCIVGDATKIIFSSNEFDMVFSNSVIEHVSDQFTMSYNAFRVGKHGLIQTPNYWTPFEPHFMIPGFQFFPRWLKAFLIQNLNLGRRGKKNSFQDALNEADSVKLLSKRQLKKMFPNVKIRTERLFGFPISYIVTW